MITVSPKSTSRRVAIAAAAAAVAVTAGCSSSPSSAPSSGSAGAGATPIEVVASTNVWGDIAKQIGGEHVNVTSIMSDPSADPHIYEADAKTAASLSKSQFVVENGLGYDDFMDKLLSASPNPNRKVLDAADVMGISGADANPHVWYDVAKVPAVATAIAERLGSLDPTDAATFTASAKTFTDSLAPVTAAIDAIKTSTPAPRSATPSGCPATSSTRRA